MTTLGVGPMVREWRDRRRLSQLDLANEAGVSSKHLSFVENGRSRPSPELLLTLARHLDVPLREQNDLLLAAGYAPRFNETALDSPEMDQIKATLATVLDRHDPYPGIVLDRQWNVVTTNRSAALLADLVPDELRGPPFNLFRASLHPDGLAAHTRNFDRWASYLTGHLRRLVNVTADPTLIELEREVLAYPNVAELLDTGSEAPFATTGATAASMMLPCEMTVGGVDLSLLTTLTTFGSPLDITLDELMIELFYPADERTAEVLEALLPD